MQKQKHQQQKQTKLKIKEGAFIQRFEGDYYLRWEVGRRKVILNFHYYLQYQNFVVLDSGIH